MASFCCCKIRSRSPPSPSARRLSLPTPPPPVKLPGPPSISAVPHAVAGPSKTPNADPRASPAHGSRILGTPAEPVELGELVIEESDSEDEPPLASRNRSSSTLNFVKTRIRRHLSSDSIHSRPRTGSGTGNSDDVSVARRAELRRLMHKRIQEELHSEDASRVTGARRPSRRHSNTYVEKLPRGGPRDNVEFAVDERAETPVPGSKRGTLKGKEVETASVRSERSRNDENKNPRDRRASCPGHFGSEEGESSRPRPTPKAPLRDRTSLPHLASTQAQVTQKHKAIPKSKSFIVTRRECLDHDPVDAKTDKDSVEPREADEGVAPSPNAESESPASIEEATEEDMLHRDCSSRISQSTPVAQEKLDLSVPPGDGLDQSPLNTWLRSQGLRSRSPSSAGSITESQGDEEGTVHEAQIVKLTRPPSSILDLDGNRVDELAPPRIIHLHEMDIHNQLGTRGRGTPATSPQRSATHVRGPSLMTQASCISSLSLPPPSSELPSTLEDASNAENTPPGLDPQTSSIYPSSVDTECPSRADSGTDSGRRRIMGLQLSALRRVSNGYKSNGRPVLRPRSRRALSIAASIQSLPLPGIRKAGNDSRSVSVSETSSFQRQEAELSTIEKRFGKSSLRRGPSIPLMSRFKEEFSELGDERLMKKPSLLSKLYSSIPRKVRLTSRGPGGQENRPSGTRTSSLGNIFGAVRGILPPDPNVPGAASPRLATGELATASKTKGRQQDLDGLGRVGDQNESSMRNEAGPSDQSLDEWAQELHEQEREAKAHSGPAMAGSIPKTPKVWPKPSSNSRSQQAGFTGTADSTSRKASAARQAPTEVEPEWSTGKTKYPQHENPAPNTGTSFSSLGRAMKAGFMNKVTPKRGDLVGRYATVKRLGSADSEHLSAHGDIVNGGNADNAEANKDGTPTKHMDADGMAKLNGEGSAFATPGAAEGRRQRETEASGSSTVATTKYATPLSRMSPYDDAASRRSSFLAGLYMNAGAETDADSVKSDTTAVMGVRSSTAPDLGAATKGQTKFMTWSGRAKTQPVLMSSTLEFGIELERMLQEEREKIKALARCGLESGETAAEGAQRALA